MNSKQNNCKICDPLEGFGSYIDIYLTVCINVLHAGCNRMSTYFESTHTHTHTHTHHFLYICFKFNHFCLVTHQGILSPFWQRLRCQSAPLPLIYTPKLALILVPEPTL